MNILNVEGVWKSYSEKPLLNNINLGIEDTDKIGVIGINGTGKTTMLKIISGIEMPDQGRIVKGNQIRIEYLSQSTFFPKGAKISDVAFGYECETILTKLGISDFNAKIDNLSGGQRKRVALAKVLASPCELLVLDEPTNHLDSEAISWLEAYLNKRKGALLMITHDRYFLDRVVNEMLEIDKGNIYTYKGNYSYFLEKKLEREELESANEKKRRSLYRKELAWIKRGAKARSTKQKARIDRFESIKENAADLSKDTINLTMDSSRLGKKIIELNHICKSYNGVKYIDDFTYTFQKGDSIGIVGSNGSGKSTFINIVNGTENPDLGTVVKGDTVKIGLFSQETTFIQEEQRVIDYIREISPVNAVKLLEQFLFPSDMQWAPVSKLSGGEKRRLYLLRVLAENPNVLLLDEPTNDLDIETLNLLEDFLDDFPGVIVAVSHDRYFLDRIAEKIFVFEEGSISIHTGNYFDYIEEKKKNNKIVTLKTLKEKVDIDKPNKIRTLKFSYKEEREYNNIDIEIEGLENKINEIEINIGKASSDYIALKSLLEEKENLEKALEEKMERWVYLNDLAEKIKTSKTK